MSDTCVACGDGIYAEHEEWEWVCGTCRAKYPASLIKSCGDMFDYALGLRTGEVIRYQEARIQGEWVHLRGSEKQGNAPVEGLQFPCCRGVDVRLADIVWCADAPEGS